MRKLCTISYVFTVWMASALLAVYPGGDICAQVTTAHVPDTGHVAPPPLPVYCTFASKARRKAFYQNFLVNYIQRDLPRPLADSTEDEWSDPFYGMELMGYKTPYTLNRITQAWEHMSERSFDFQQAFLELVFTNYPHIFKAQVAQLLQQTPYERIFSLCAEYLLADPGDYAARVLIRKQMAARLDTTKDITLELLRKRLNHEGVPTLTPPLEDLLSAAFLSGQTVVFSIQRSNRDYPGLVVIRKADGTFLKNADSTYFAVPELARSITNLPYFVHDGNTPQGIYRMEGFGESSSQFLGPTPNIQLRMPYEVTPAVFFHNKWIGDTAWRLEQYRRLLPASWSADFSIFGSFYAGLVGRREVIAHGTTIDPNYYKNNVWFPQTPSLGCLCAHESWDDQGKRVSSDQQKIIDALDSVGGAHGYLVVVDLDDWPGPVTLASIQDRLKSAEKVSAFRSRPGRRVPSRGRNPVSLNHHAPVSLSRKNAAHEAG